MSLSSSQTTNSKSNEESELGLPLALSCKRLISSSDEFVRFKTARNCILLQLSLTSSSVCIFCLFGISLYNTVGLII